MSFNITIVLSIFGIIIGIAFISYFIILFNNYIYLKNLVKKSKANIDVLLKQRFDEITKLTDVVKGYMNYEAQLLTEITNQRTQIMNSNMNAKAIANNKINEILNQIFIRAENYPQLKANKNFLQLQQRITSIESEIAQRREFYNETVTNYNSWIEIFPNNMMAKIFKASKEDLFEIKNKKIEVNL